MHRRIGQRVFGPMLLAGVLGLGGPVEADTLEVDPDLGYVPIEELSYETIIRPGSGYEADLAIRIALDNASANPQDMVEAIGLPQGSEVVGLAVDFDGTWIEADESLTASHRGRRDPGTVFVRALAPDTPGDLPGAEVVAFGLPARTTTQIEIRVRVFPSLRGDRWQLELPRRHLDGLPHFTDRRRVLVQGLPAGEGFWVDDADNGKSPSVITRAEDAVVVSWPAHLANSARLDGNLEVRRDPSGEDGRLRMVLRLGSSEPMEPDHVLLVVDRSRSASTSLPADAGDLLVGLLTALPARTTFDAIAFARTAEPLLGEEDAFPKRDSPALENLLGRMAKLAPAQGTDLRAAMTLAGERLRARDAKAPLIVVVSDGMFPRSVPAAEIDRALIGNSKRESRPEILFVVDDPLVSAQGLPADHPVAELAAGLGARISLETLAHGTHAELLAAPRVLGELHLGLPDTVVLDQDLPIGLVAGDFVVIEGSYYGKKPPAKVTVRGRMGKTRVKTTISASKRPAPPSAWSVAWREGDREQTAAEGSSMPEWYTPSMRRTTTANLAQAGKVGWQATGQLDASIVRRELRIRVLPRARACYNQALARHPGLAGRVELEMEAGKGEVMIVAVGKAELSHGDAELLTCLEQAAWSLDLPAANLDSQVYAIRYPLEFTAPEGSAEAVTSPADAALVERLVESAEVLADFQKAEKAKSRVRLERGRGVGAGAGAELRGRGDAGPLRWW